jgi:hypothetical protein
MQFCCLALNMSLSTYIHQKLVQTFLCAFARRAFWRLRSLTTIFLKFLLKKFQPRHESNGHVYLSPRYVFSYVMSFHIIHFILISTAHALFLTCPPISIYGT